MAEFYAKEIDGRVEVKPRNKITVNVTELILDDNGNKLEQEFQVLNPSHELLIADGWAEYVEPEIVANDEPDRLGEIEALKGELASTDYKIIKCMEAYLCGEELPYDIAALHAERNAKREEINNLEA